MAETRHLFIEKRDGRAAAVQWAQQTMKIYRQAVLNKAHHASRKEFRRQFIESYCVFKRYSLDHDQPSG